MAVSIAALSSVGGILMVYNIFTVAKARKRSSLMLSTMLHAVDSFVSKHIEQNDTPTVVLLVQSLRNYMMVAIFIGGISFQSFQVACAAISLTTTPIENARTLILSSFLICSFLNFALVIRCAAHLGILLGSTQRHSAVHNITGDNPLMNKQLSIENTRFTCTSLMRSMCVHFSLGFRCLFSSVPYSFGASGPIPLFLSGLLILALQVYADNMGGKFQEII